MIETVGDYCDFLYSALSEVGQEPHAIIPAPPWVRNTPIIEAIEADTALFAYEHSLWDDPDREEFLSALFKASGLAQHTLGIAQKSCYDCWKASRVNGLREILKRAVCEHI